MTLSLKQKDRDGLNNLFVTNSSKENTQIGNKNYKEPHLRVKMNQSGNFHYRGTLSASKSLMNRALILKSFFPNLNILGDSSCDDVKLLKKALHCLKEEKSDTFDCGQGGTCLRFLLARVSRKPGSYFLKTHPTLLKRPHGELLKALEQMEVKWKIKKDQGISIISKGWKISDPITLNLNKSSQYASALLLSAWNLQKPLILHLNQINHSQSYLRMTLSFLRQMGLEIIEIPENQTSSEISPSSKPTKSHGSPWITTSQPMKTTCMKLLIPPKQKIKKTVFEMEPDMDSAFALGALATVSGSLELEFFPGQSEQPSFAFIKILKKMGVKINYDSKQKNLSIKKTTGFRAIDTNLALCPDLFPILSVLLSRARGESRLHGLDLLIYKESDRLEKVSELLTNMNFKYEKSENSITIEGEPEHEYPPCFDFDPAWDHRMVMAATLATFQGASIKIHQSHTVRKSFPEFFDILSLC